MGWARCWPKEHFGILFTLHVGIQYEDVQVIFVLVVEMARGGNRNMYGLVKCIQH